MADPVRETTGAAVLRGGAWSLASRVTAQVYLAVLSIAGARFLGPDDFGRQSFIAFTGVSLVILLSAGVPQAIVRYVGDAIGRGDPDSALGIEVWGWRIQLVAGILGAGILWAVAAGGSEPQAAWVFVGVSSAAGVLAGAPRAFLNGLQQWRAPSLVAIWVGALGVIATVIVLAAGGGITGMFAVDAVTTAIALVILTILARRAIRALGASPHLDRALRSDAIRYTLLTSVTTVLTFVVWRRTELFFLDVYSNDAQIGFYSIAFTAAYVPVLLFQGLAAALLPSIATLMAAGQTQRVRSGVSRSARLMLVVALPATAAALALGPELVRVLYGEEFADVAAPLIILLALTPFVPLIYVAMSVLGAIGRMRPVVMAGLAASFVNVGLDVLLIPDYEAVGAAIANVGAQLTLGIPITLIAWREVGPIDWQRSAVVGAAVTSILAGVVAWSCVAALGGVLGLVVGAGAGIGVFTVTAAVIGLVSPADASWLDTTLGGLFGGRLGRLLRLWERN
jgi:O-antigen/teichoic acid export membrane protein